MLEVSQNAGAVGRGVDVLPRDLAALEGEDVDAIPLSRSPVSLRVAVAVHSQTTRPSRA